MARARDSSPKSVITAHEVLTALVISPSSSNLASPQRAPSSFPSSTEMIGTSLSLQRAVMSLVYSALSQFLARQQSLAVRRSSALAHSWSPFLRPSWMRAFLRTCHSSQWLKFGRDD
jgi:hypothetical protein